MATKLDVPAPQAPLPPRRNEVLDPGEQVALAHGIHRSGQWHEVEQAHLAKEPRCVACGEKARAGQAVQVHHVFPFHFCIALGRPDLELDPRNLITLCQSEENRPEQDHHLLVGHLDSFASSNLDVRHDASRLFLGQTAQQIRASARWQALVRARLAPLEQMTEVQKRAFVEEMNRRLPRR